METSRPVVVAFDLDGTLTEGGSVFHWLMHVAGRRPVLMSAARLLLPLTIGAWRSGHAADSAKERLFHRVLAGRDVERVRSISRDFALAHLHEKGRRRVIERLRWHLASGHDVVIVSASPQLYVDVITEALGAHGGLGTRLEVRDGKLTGHYDGANCRGEEKLRRLQTWIGERHYGQSPELFAYGNSRGDLRILAHANHGFNVGRMGRCGRLRNYLRLPEHDS